MIVTLHDYFFVIIVMLRQLFHVTLCYVMQYHVVLNFTALLTSQSRNSSFYYTNPYPPYIPYHTFLFSPSIFYLRLFFCSFLFIHVYSLPLYYLFPTIFFFFNCSGWIRSSQISRGSNSHMLRILSRHHSHCHTRYQTFRGKYTHFHALVYVMMAIFVFIDAVILIQRTYFSSTIFCKNPFHFI